MPLCKYPIYLKQAGGLVPCGRCFTCRLALRRRKTSRLVFESMLHEKSIWVLLTYALKNEPREHYDLNTGEIFSAPEGSRGTLSPRDTELFIKRLRKALFPTKLRFFLCGEYGASRNPHYHVCLFGIGPEAMPIVQKCWSNPETNEPLGFAGLGANRITFENAQYTCGYTVKKLTKKGDDKLNGRYPEFIRESKGIGSAAVPRIVEALGGLSALAHMSHARDIPRTLLINGRTHILDRYLREKILEQLPSLQEDFKLVGRGRFAAEMSALSHDQIRTVPSSLPSAGYALTASYTRKNAQRILNMEGRAKLTGKKEKL